MDNLKERRFDESTAHSQCPNLIYSKKLSVMVILRVRFQRT